MNRIVKTIYYFINYYGNYVIRYKGDKVAYLRYLGVRIGANCSILTSIEHFGSEPWLVELGDNVTLSAGVALVTHDGSSRLFRGIVDGMNPLYGNLFGTIYISNNSFISLNTIILPNVRIGPNAIVGAGSVVTRDVPPNSVYAGVPARHICSLDEYIEKYKSKMIPIMSSDRTLLRQELTERLWGEGR